MRVRQNAALHYPFGYAPDMKNPDISGGDLGHFDQDGFNRDINHVLNP
jgi:hypothetical protein